MDLCVSWAREIIPLVADTRDPFPSSFTRFCDTKKNDHDDKSKHEGACFIRPRASMLFAETFGLMIQQLLWINGKWA